MALHNADSVINEARRTILGPRASRPQGGIMCDFTIFSMRARRPRSQETADSYEGFTAACTFAPVIYGNRA